MVPLAFGMHVEQQTDGHSSPGVQVKWQIGCSDEQYLCGDKLIVFNFRSCTILYVHKTFGSHSQLDKQLFF